MASHETQSANLVMLTDNPQAYQTFAKLLTNFDFNINSQRVENIDALGVIHAKTPIDLLAYWYTEDSQVASRLLTFLRSVPQPPVTLLISQSLSAQNYIEAAKLGASDVINAKLLAQFPFVVQRELINLKIRRRLDDTVRRLEELSIVNESELKAPVDVVGMNEMVPIIDEALKNDEFELLFQPIIAVEDDGCDNYEIFLRIKHQGEYILPGEFLPVAEQYGLIASIDRWVVKHAVRRFKAEEQVKKIKNRNERKLRFFVNLSGHSLVDQVVLNNIIREIYRAKLSPRSFVIEIDKNTILSRLETVKALNRNIKKLQLEFAIDVYEASDNALNYLQHLKLDYIKLSQKTVAALNEDDSKRDEVKEIVRKAKANNIRVIASQVENASLLPTLYELGVHYLQGYAIAEPDTRLDYSMVNTTLEHTMTFNIG